MRLTILTLILAALIYDVCAAATLYMGSEETYTNLQAAMAAMSSGDTLIIRDGTYTGATNVLDYTHFPPSGSAEAYTTIQAENPGKAIFDGENARFMFSLYGSSDESGPHHIVFDGLQWRNSNADLVIIVYADYIKAEDSDTDVIISVWVDSATGDPVKTGTDTSDVIASGYPGFFFAGGSNVVWSVDDFSDCEF